MVENSVLLFDEVIRDLYGLALVPDRWPSALDRVASLSESTGAVLFVKTLKGWSCPVHSTTLDAAIKAYLEEGWAARNPWLKGRLKAGFQIGEVYSDLDIATPEELRTSAFYSDFLRRFELGYQMVGMLHSDLGSLTCLVAHRQIERGPFRPAEKQAHLLVSRHVEQLLHLSSTLASTKAELRTASAALDAMGKPAIIVDEHQRAVTMNAAAETLMDRYFDRNSDRLKPILAHEDRDFQKVVEGAHLPSYRSGSAPAVTMLSPKDGGERMVIRGIPLVGHSADTLGFQTTHRNVLILAHPLVQDRRVDPTIIRAVFGITTAEAKLASCIAAGQTIKATAEELGLTEGTVRVVLKRIFAKMNVNRQSDLVVRILDLRH